MNLRPLRPERSQKVSVFNVFSHLWHGICHIFSPKVRVLVEDLVKVLRGKQWRKKLEILNLVDKQPGICYYRYVNSKSYVSAVIEVSVMCWRRS